MKNEDSDKLTAEGIERAERTLFTGLRLVDPADTETWILPEEAMIVHPEYKTCSIPDIHRMSDCRLCQRLE